MTKTCEEALVEAESMCAALRMDLTKAECQRDEALQETTRLARQVLEGDVALIRLTKELEAEQQEVALKQACIVGMSRDLGEWVSAGASVQVKSPGAMQQAKHMADAAVRALELSYITTSPSDITEGITALRARAADLEEKLEIAAMLRLSDSHKSEALRIQVEDLEARCHGLETDPSGVYTTVDALRTKLRLVEAALSVDDGAELAIVEALEIIRG